MTGGFTFGATQGVGLGTAGTQGFSFGGAQTNTTQPSTSFSFGTPSTQQNATSGGFALGGGQSAGTGFSFGTTPQQTTTQPAKTGFSFGGQTMAQTQAAATTMPLNLAAPQQQNPQQPKGGFSFGTPQQQTQAVARPAAAAASFTYGTPQTTAQQAAGAGFTLGGTPAQTTAATAFTLGGGGGLNLSQKTTTASPAASNFGVPSGFGGNNFQLGKPATTTSGAIPTLGATTLSGNTTGFNLGNTTTSGLTLGSATTTGLAQGSATTSGLTLGGAPNTGLSLGGTTTTGLSLGGTTATGLGGTTATGLGGTSTGFSLSGATTGLTQGGTTSGLTLGGTTSATTTGGFGLGGTSTTGGLTLGAAKPAAATSGFSLGGGLTGAATTATVTPTLTLGAATTTSSGGFSLGGGLGGIATTTATGIFGGTSTTTTAVTGIFGTAASATASTGLGGVDPKTTSSGAGVGGVAGKPGESKAVKETNVLPEVCLTVENFKKYVKKQKSVRENIARMSSTPMYKVQEEVVNLKQLLSLVSNGLQRNAITIDKLKQQSAQELKHAEIAHRTKETPPGLQYEHTAPTQYFQRLVDDFEGQMIFYRQQIEEMENHLTSLNQGIVLTPQELSQLLSKLHETFIALASQLQAVHEAVKVQKEHYLNFRRVFHGDSTDVFEKRRLAKAVTGSSVLTKAGPTPFTGMSNAAAIAMATTLNRNQQPTGLGLGTTGFGAGQTTGIIAPTAAPGTGGLFGALPSTNLGTGFGAISGFGGLNTTATQPTGFGTAFGAANTSAIRPLGSTAGTGLLGASTTAQQSAGFNFSTPATNTAFGGGAAAAGTQGTTGGVSFGNTTAFGTQSANGQQTFQLQNPPLGTKRGKKA